MIWFLFLYDGPRTPDCMWFQQGLGGGLARMTPRPQLHGPPSVQDSCSLSYGQDGLGELSPHHPHPSPNVWRGGWSPHSQDSQWGSILGALRSRPAEPCERPLWEAAGSVHVWGMLGSSHPPLA